LSLLFLDDDPKGSLSLLFLDDDPKGSLKLLLRDDPKGSLSLLFLDDDPKGSLKLLLRDDPKGSLKLLLRDLLLPAMPPCQEQVPLPLLRLIEPSLQSVFEIEFGIGMSPKENTVKLITKARFIAALLLRCPIP
jgi:hypothetical protein